MKLFSVFSFKILLISGLCFILNTDKPNSIGSYVIGQLSINIEVSYTNNQTTRYTLI